MVMNVSRMLCPECGEIATNAGPRSALIAAVDEVELACARGHAWVTKISVASKQSDPFARDARLYLDGKHIGTASSIEWKNSTPSSTPPAEVERFQPGTKGLQTPWCARCTGEIGCHYVASGPFVFCSIDCAKMGAHGAHNRTDQQVVESYCVDRDAVLVSRVEREADVALGMRFAEENVLLRAEVDRLRAENDRLAKSRGLLKAGDVEGESPEDLARRCDTVAGAHQIARADTAEMWGRRRGGGSVSDIDRWGRPRPALHHNHEALRIEHLSKQALACRTILDALAFDDAPDLAALRSQARAVLTQFCDVDFDEEDRPHVTQE